MPFPLKKKIGGMMSKPGMIDDPADEMTQSPHAEPDGDEEMNFDDIMGQDIEGGEEGGPLFEESPLESALTDAGFKATPEQLSQIEAILKPKAPAPKPMGGGLGAKIGGAVPGGMKSSDLPAM